MTDFTELTEQLERVHTSRLALRPVALCDAWPLYVATRNPEFNRNLLWPQPHSDLQVLERIQGVMDVARRGGMTALSAVLKSTGEWVSLYRFQPYEADPKLVEMGIWTHEKFWEDRYSLELTQACVDSAFALTEIPLLIGGASPDNRASCRILERCGLTATCIIHRHSETNVERTSQEFQITRAQWVAHRKVGTFDYVPEALMYPNGGTEANLFAQFRDGLVPLAAGSEPLPPADTALTTV